MGQSCCLRRRPCRFTHMAHYSRLCLFNRPSAASLSAGETMGRSNYGDGDDGFRNCARAKLSLPGTILYAEPAAREPPIDVVVRTAGETGRTLHTILKRRRDLLPIPAVDVRRAKCRAGPVPLLPTGGQAYVVVADADVALFVMFVGQQEEFVF